MSYVLTEFLERPLMTVDVLASSPDLGHLHTMLPLEDGSILVNNIEIPKRHITRLSNRGNVIRHLITSYKPIQSLVISSSNTVLVLHKDGTILHVRIQDGEIVEQHQIQEVKWLYDGIKMADGNLLLTDCEKGEIFKYNLMNRHKEVVIRNLKWPTTVDKADMGLFYMYIVCEYGADSILVYNDTWGLVTRIGRRGARGGEFKSPQSAKVLPDNSIIVSDWYNNRVSRFTIQGKFEGHLLQRRHGIRRPVKLAVQYPHIWLSYGENPWNIKCFQIYQ